MTIEETVKWFNSIFEINKRDNQKKKDFCIGLVSDIGRVTQECKDVKLLGYTKCDNLEVAQKLVESMRNDGFCIMRKENAESTPTSIFVYLCEKGT